MKSLTGASRLSLVLLLQLLPAQTSLFRGNDHSDGDILNPLEFPPRTRPVSPVMDFQEVLAKSMCRPMEQLVDVEREFPGDVEYIYVPTCVPLWRCSGCCGDETLECRPTLERNVTLQVMKILPLRSKHSAEITFVEHQKCECRARQKHPSSQSTEFIKNRPRRRKHKKTANGCGKCQYPHNKISLH